MSHARVGGRSRTKTILDAKTEPIQTMAVTGTVKGSGCGARDPRNNEVQFARFRCATVSMDLKFEATDKSIKRGRRRNFPPAPPW
jgi:hypothetical protein